MIKSNRKTKLVARVMLLVLLLASSTNLTGCMNFLYDWEVNTHEEFVKEVEKYNSINNGSVDTFISFDLDSYETVSKKMYNFKAMPGYKGLVEKYGLYDIYDEYYDIYQVFYLSYDYHEYAYKIRYHYNRNHTQNNFTQQDKIEITISDEKHCDSIEADLYYQASLDNGSVSYRVEENRLYSHTYYYEVYVNGVNFGCIHISSIEEASEEKLAEIIQMMQDSLVVINTEKNFIWRDQK